MTNTGTVVISAEEYRELLCTELRFNATANALEKAERDNIQLKDFVLNRIVSTYKMNQYGIEDLTNPTDYSFPFDFTDLLSAGISIEYAIEWIRRNYKEKVSDDE